MLTVCALFAGFTGVVLVNLIIHTFGGSPGQAPPSAYLHVSIGLAALALWLFALSAERITDALDENRVKVYLFAMLTYNLGVISVFIALDLLLYHFWRDEWAFAPLVLVIWPWLYDFLWLLSSRNRATYEAEIIQPA